jgi:hypothetical protein
MSGAEKSDALGTWYRVFGMNQDQPEPQAIVECLRRSDIPSSATVNGDDLGWFQLELVLADSNVTRSIGRFLASEPGIRAELNTWAAWLETQENQPRHAWLMERIIGTVQLFAWSGSINEPHEAHKTDAELCRFLAHETAGIYQIDGQGFFAADGTLLLSEA